MADPNNEKDVHQTLFGVSKALIYTCILLAVFIAIMAIGVFKADKITPQKSDSTTTVAVAKEWQAPAPSSIPAGKEGDEIRYGRELISHTAKYLGPKGSVAAISNGMNCQNCHLDGGSRLLANNYSGFIAGYPKLSNRSGHVEPASERVTECFERSLNGKAPAEDSREMKAILAYMTWVGNGVKKGQKPKGTATERLPYLNIAASPAKGKPVYVAKCQVCHGANGEGMLAADNKTYVNPPLWGKNSFNDGAGMHRISNLAGYVKNNMPFGVTYKNPQLTDEEAWNVAAYIESKPRPHKEQADDWANLDKKPIDHPFGPYKDQFSEEQHKYGPFKPILAAQSR
ncbi:cytochrome C [Mucilaginibacter conchicola]|uniref:Cytochrome C n=1 Tax=Mucilaginibacter conchicola TaxID=2303333 RepID=A0A372NXP4_9SPHI|nr:c-type cytochrome [Mucilaginibacter conchicola]RFZ94641.1 cytochrome C [Mucilaginibacter conchicola]